MPRHNKSTEKELEIGLRLMSSLAAQDSPEATQHVRYICGEFNELRATKGGLLELVKWCRQSLLGNTREGKSARDKDELVAERKHLVLAIEARLNHEGESPDGKD